MKTNITNGMAAENRSRCENSTPASSSMARRPMLNSSVARRPARPNRTMDSNRLLNSSVRPTSRPTANVMNRSAWMKEVAINCSRMECMNVFGHSKEEMVSGTARWDQTLERAYNDYCNEECNVNSARRPVTRRPMLNSSVRRPAMRRPISRPVLNSSARRPLANRPLLNSSRQSLRSVLEKAHAARLNSSLRPMSRRKLNSSEEDVFDDADFDVTEDTEIIDANVDNTAEAIPAEEVPVDTDGAVDVTELLIVQDPESKELSLFIQDTEDETLPESVEVIAAVDPATEADLDSSCGGKKKLNSSEEDGAENAAEGADDAEKADTDADTDTAETAETEESVEIELADGDTVAVEDIYVVQSEDGELDLFIAEEGAELPESVEVVGEAVAVDESEVLDSSRKMIKRTGAKLNAGKKAQDMSYEELNNTYTWTFKKYPGASSVCRYENIGYKETRYEKKGSKWVETKSDNRTVDCDWYYNTVDAVPFFKNLGGKEKVDVAYTKVGYLPVRVTSINPTGDEKVVREFNFDSATPRKSS